jgi:hypothetical protein
LHRKLNFGNILLAEPPLFIGFNNSLVLGGLAQASQEDNRL